MFYISQMGDDFVLKKPESGEDNYGYVYSDDENVIMNGTLKELVTEFEINSSFRTYPVGFYKKVTLSEQEMDEIAACISELCGMSRDEWEGAVDAYESGISYFLDKDSRYIQVEEVPWGVVMDPSVTYEQFLQIMERVSGIIGPGSEYEQEKLKTHGVVDKNYEQALSDYEDILYKDKVTGA